LQQKFEARAKIADSLIKDWHARAAYSTRMDADTFVGKR